MSWASEGLPRGDSGSGMACSAAVSTGGGPTGIPRLFVELIAPLAQPGALPRPGM